MHRTIALFVALLMLTNPGWAPTAPPDIKTQVEGFTPGAGIEVHLNTTRTARGTRGAVSDAGFTLVDSKGQERQIAFVDVTSVNQVKSHVGRNVAIVAGVAAVVVLAFIGRHV
jgi:hypothetical protein